MSTDKPEGGLSGGPDRALPRARGARGAAGRREPRAHGRRDLRHVAPQPAGAPGARRAHRRVGRPALLRLLAARTQRRAPRLDSEPPAPAQAARDRGLDRARPGERRREGDGRLERGVPREAPARHAPWPPGPCGSGARARRTPLRLRDGEDGRGKPQRDPGAAGQGLGTVGAARAAPHPALHRRVRVESQRVDQGQRDGEAATHRAPRERVGAPAGRVLADRARGVVDRRAGATRRARRPGGEVHSWRPRGHAPPAVWLPRVRRVRREFPRAEHPRALRLRLGARPGGRRSAAARSAWTAVLWRSGSSERFASRC